MVMVINISIIFIIIVFITTRVSTFIIFVIHSLIFVLLSLLSS